MSDLHAAIEHFENSPALSREFAYTLQAMKDARDALEQAQFACRHNADYIKELDDARKQGVERIKQLEAALNEIAHGTVNGMKNGGIMCRAIAKNVLESAGDSGNK